MNNKNQSQSILSWMASERLYEEFLFFYILIIIFWEIIRLLSFDFEFSSYNLKQDLLFKFLWFLILATAMAHTIFWYRFIFRTKARL